MVPLHRRVQRCAREYSSVHHTPVCLVCEHSNAIRACLPAIVHRFPLPRTFAAAYVRESPKGSLNFVARDKIILCRILLEIVNHKKKKKMFLLFHNGNERYKCETKENLKVFLCAAKRVSSESEQPVITVHRVAYNFTTTFTESVSPFLCFRFSTRSNNNPIRLLHSR